MSHFSNSLIAWYVVNPRDLPWRHTENPYHIWVSEIMLQQTQAVTVIPYYQRFIETLPTIEDLAHCEEDKLLKLWEGLGYYSRVRNMQKTAIEIMAKYSGVFPNTYDQLIQLKGIGAYTAGAILSIAFHQKFSAVDGNVMRVISRFFGIQDDITLDTTKKRINQLNESLLSDEQPHLYTQAIIELGATICTKHQPKCDVCPVRFECISRQQNLQSIIPVKAKAKAKKERHFITFILQDDQGKFVVEKVTDNLLKGLYILPQVEADGIQYAIETLESNGYRIRYTEPLGKYKHVFSHLIWYMEVYYGRIDSQPQHEVVHHFDDVPMATAHKQITNREKKDVNH
jgi:A/G-specific adenine glycosylase